MDKRLKFLEDNSEAEQDVSKLKKEVTHEKVTLVCFGPGNPELLTLKSVSYLKKAE